MKKFNIVDYLLILILVLVFGIGIYKSFANKSRQTAEKIKDAQILQNSNCQAIVSYKIKNIRKIACDKIIADSICEIKHINYCSKIENVKFENYYEYLLNEDNNYVKCDYSDRYISTFDVSMTGDIKRSGFYICDDVFVGVDTVQILTINGIDFECLVTDINIQ